jgi:GT2 family glycosyltransferase
LEGSVDPLVYVDSGSTDGSVEHARDRGVDVVELSSSVPFTAARARNAGFERAQELAPDAELVMFVDGDCEVDADWLPTALSFLAEHPGYAVACGRRRERYPDASIYNYLCDVEWNTPIGDAKACGGDAVMRVEALASVGGFDPTLIAGEEPELCTRLRIAGWKVRRLDAEMTLHDAALSRFSEWWQRAKRAGHAYAESIEVYDPSERDDPRSHVRRTLFWGLVLPAGILALLPMTSGYSAGLLLLYPLNTARIAMRLRRNGEPRPWLVATFLMLAKFPETLGWIRYRLGRATGRRSRIIEYKGT